MAPTANGAVNPMSGIPFISKGLVQAGRSLIAKRKGPAGQRQSNPVSSHDHKWD